MLTVNYEKSSDKINLKGGYDKLATSLISTLILHANNNTW